ncbi:MAG: alpha/beta fold hydrolase [Sedimentisphaerales bacterium]|nr:alpha/beta fold hydrolase [Sedimentisphaerales bacterium]
MKNKKSKGVSYKRIQVVGRVLGRTVIVIMRALFYPLLDRSGRNSVVGVVLGDSAKGDKPVSPGHQQLHKEESVWWRIGRGVLVRALAVPILGAVATGLVIYGSTHAERAKIRSFPDGMRLYYESVSFSSADGISLSGWFIPSLRAEDVTEQGDKALRRQRPGVVLCHGLGSNRSQLLPLAGYLNNQGYEVLLFDFRGCGLSGGEVQSFGLCEREDVVAAVHYLADRASVDSTRLVVIGQDVGGAAALSAAAMDYSIKAVIVSDVDKDVKSGIERRLAEPGKLSQLATTGFMLGYKSYFNTEDRELSLEQTAEYLSSNQSMLVIAQSNDDNLMGSADSIAGHSRADTQVLAVKNSYPSPLLHVDKIGKTINEFLHEVLGDLDP